MANGKVDIFGVNFDNMTITEIAGQLLVRIRSEVSITPLTVFTPNPEIVMEAQKDKELLAVLSTADIISADGIGIVWASKYFGEKIKKRASGYDIVQELFSLGKPNGFTAFFLGGSADAVSKAAANMEAKYPWLKITGYRDGYFKDNETKAITDEINKTAPDLLLVGLGSPKQEKWVNANKQALKVKVIIAVGGSFDVMSGNLKRAPEIFQKLGLEWFYRLITQPSRIRRMARLPKFALKVLLYGKKYKSSSN